MNAVTLRKKNIIKSEVAVCSVNNNDVSGGELIENIDVVPDRGVCYYEVNN